VGVDTYRLTIVEALLGDPRLPCQPLLPANVVLAVATPADSVGPERSAALLAVLSDDERVRLRRFRFERDRRTYLVAHALVRNTLSRYADVPPEAWQFRPGIHGRPEISAPATQLRFSLSHTAGLAACAVILERDIGVDVEDRSRRTAAEGAERVFSERERRDLCRASTTDHRDRKFLEYWTLKEAYIKARGLGLSLPLEQFSVYTDSGGQWRIAFEPPLKDDPARWWLWSSRLGNNHQAALAIGMSPSVEMTVHSHAAVTGPGYSAIGVPRT
jgi:4'-phosphopantetheinyl transferase